LEAELLDLKSNPNKPARGTVIEARLDKGRGTVATVLVQDGTLKIGDAFVGGVHSGRVRALMDERGKRIKAAGPSTPVQLLGLTGTPQAGDRFIAYEDERKAKEVASRRSELFREQSLRQQKRLTLEEVARRNARGEFKELKIIVKGDVDGSVEALSDSLLKLSFDEVQVNVIRKAVGQISEADVLLASASEAIIIGFQVRPSVGARKLAETEGIDIRHYSVIYDAINDVKDALEGLLSPELKEEITGTAEIRNVFKITKVGSVGGCMVTDGSFNRKDPIRLIREGIVIFTGTLASLKRFKDDVREVQKGFECGMQVNNYNDIHEGDIIEQFRTTEIHRKLK
jgi:translation initiation factor IF-2